ncbi:hypothetical protein [Chromobacterium sp. IIBBL 290-4]|uniref:hypothetical protein n=1 Tax=Chromobacterium sp. IIBBL 290-4 TaxID=2953890 RepID=UPI0020B736F4|nr:hypothetical protein [Chromobacterium sp. IIBBL 290-4]UTH74081.1 hypothetical protein NKT35_21450 [Chromobacterium sp. IIBBL 290-4]
MDLPNALLTLPFPLRGSGINHEDQHFSGTLQLQILPGANMILGYAAHGENSELYHQESTLLGCLPDGALCLWPAMDELPFILAHPVTRQRRPSTDLLIAEFASGPLDDTHRFRQQISIELDLNGRLRYAHAWGLPDGEFADRSYCDFTFTPTTGHR